MKFKLFTALVLIFLSTLFFVFYIRQTFSSVSDDDRSVDFLINKGASIAQIGNNLEKSKLIKSATAFKFYVQLTNSTNKIQAGEFQLLPSLSLIEIINKLKKGPTELWVTIPEGLRREEIAVKFATTLNKDQAFVDEFLSLSNDKEGYLYPDTYLFSKSATAVQITNKLASTFKTKAGSEITSEQLIVASLLERETFTDEEKPVVAGILYKRLENGWPLQIDATLQYIKGDWKPIYSIDKELDSPFNTYKNLGLPPAPISNPGLSTIEASINPKDSEYWYYIHDNDGKIHFAKTLEEHNANINKYLK